jgi:hypothetical protein
MNPDFSERIEHLKEFQSVLWGVSQQLAGLATSDLSATSTEWIQDRIVLAEKVLNDAKLKLEDVD